MVTGRGGRKPTVRGALYEGTSIAAVCGTTYRLVWESWGSPELRYASTRKIVDGPGRTLYPLLIVALRTFLMGPRKVLAQFLLFLPVLLENAAARGISESLEQDLLPTVVKQVTTQVLRCLSQIPPPHYSAVRFTHATVPWAGTTAFTTRSRRASKISPRRVAHTHVVRRW